MPRLPRALAFAAAAASAPGDAAAAGDLVSNTAALTVADLTQYPTARCLDGSGAGFYYRAGVGDDTDKWLIMLEGGGLCTGEDDCTARSKTDLGSSSNYPPTMDLGGIGFMTNDTANPFRNWHQIYAKYCDGSMWMGQRENASDPATFGLWISGHNSIAALVDYFSTTHLDAPADIDASSTPRHSMAAPNSTVILSGGSAGGIGAFGNVDFVAQQLPDSLVLGAPVGGFPPALNWYSGPDSSPPDEDGRDSAFAKNEAFWGTYKQDKCLADFGPTNQTYFCNIPNHLYGHLDTPVFIIEAITDAVIMCGFEGLTCKPADLLRPEVAAFVESYAANFTESIKRLPPDTPRNGLFAASCLMHTGFQLTEPLINGTNAVDATFQWYQYHAEQFRLRRSAHEHKHPQALDARAHGGTAAAAARGEPNFVWADVCAGGKYFPPCNAKCPPVPTAEALSGPYIF